MAVGSRYLELLWGMIFPYVPEYSKLLWNISTSLGIFYAAPEYFKEL